MIRGWCRKVPIVGIYDYYYGAGFISPRIFTGLSEESLTFAHQTGVRAFYAEIYSTWSLDGPKAWVASQLLWNVNQVAEQLVDEFCRDLFGPAAAPMREYFRYCEQRWMSRPSGSTTMWEGFFDPRQLELWPPDACQDARALLGAAEQAAASASEVVLQRVRLYSQGFRQTELWSALYRDEPAESSPVDVLRFLETQSSLQDFQRDVKAQGKKRLLLSDDQRRLLAVKGKSLGRTALMELTTTVTPDIILRWHRELVAETWNYTDNRVTAGRSRRDIFGGVRPRAAGGSCHQPRDLAVLCAGQPDYASSLCGPDSAAGCTLSNDDL